MSYNSKYKGSEVDAALDLAMTALQGKDKENLATKEDVTITEGAEVSNGVYAVTSDGELIDYNIADSSCLGVALVAGEHRFMIAKNDATDGAKTTLYWGKNLYRKDVAGITNISSGADFIGEGKKYGTDFTTWSTGPVVDFNGAANTAAIIAGYTEHGVSMDAIDMCTVLNTFNAGSDNQGHSDWYVPACGQLALMYLAKTDINAALAKIGGTAFESDNYWSSSETDASGAWYVNFGGGYVYSDDKGRSYRVRFVRDIATEKKIPLKDYTLSLKDKIEEKQDKLVSGTNIKTINGESVLGEGNIEIKGGGSSAYPFLKPSSIPSELKPNTYYDLGQRAGFNINLAQGEEGVANEYIFKLKVADGGSDLILPDNIIWSNEETPPMTIGKFYEISIIDNHAVFVEF